MSLSNVIEEGLTAFQTSHAIQNGVAMSTHCLYPNNSSVIVYVRGAGDAYVVSDDGRALREASDAGAILGKRERRYERVVEKQGLLMENGIIRSPTVSMEFVPMAILLVANASKDVADSIMQTWRPARDRDFKEAVKMLVRQKFAVPVSEQTLIGTSNKPHSFDNVVQLSNGKRLIIDPVLKDPNSINARLVAHLDVHSANHQNLTQRLVYDDQASWSGDDLSLLQVSQVPAVAFSRVEQAIDKILLAA